MTKKSLGKIFVKVIDKFEHSTEDIKNKFENIENCKNPEFPFGAGNSCWSSLVEDSFFENTKEMQATETAGVSATSHDLNTDKEINSIFECPNNVVVCFLTVIRFLKI